MAEGNPWRKAEAVQVERFHEAVTGIDGVEVRKMFGFPAAFIGGNMTAGLHQETVMVAQGSEEKEGRLADPRGRRQIAEIRRGAVRGP